MMRSVRATLFAALVAVGCDGAPQSTAERSDPVVAETSGDADAVVAAPLRTPEAAADPALVSHGAELITKYECNRCHTVDGVEPATAELDCAGCHKSIQDGSFTALPDKLPEFQRRVHSLLHVPVLSGTNRFRRDWIASFVPDAYDIRPNLGPTMPRFRMPAEDAAAIAAFLSPTAEEAVPELGDAAKGRRLIEAKGCISCHRFTGVKPLAALPISVKLEPDAFSRAQKIAPDLRFARDRLRPAAVVRWLLDPAAQKSDTLMPKLGLSDEEAADIAAYLLTEELEDIEYPSIPQRLPVLERAVTYAEVYDKMFGALCRHCHSDPNQVIGDGGPGYVGGFGFPRRALDLSTYEGVLSGSLDDNGKRRSVFKAVDDDDTPRIVAHLWARHSEVAGQPVEGVRGMPLGLPPLPAEDIQLLETWIAQGRKKGTR